MKLHELHVHQRRAGVVGERVAVASIFPTVAGDFESAADAAGGQHNRFGAEQLVSPALAFIAESASYAVATFEQRDDGTLHMDIHALMDAVILQGADHLESGTVAHMGQARILVPSEIAL